MVVCVFIGGPRAGVTFGSISPQRFYGLPVMTENGLVTVKYELQSTPGNVAEYKPVKPTEVAP